MFRDYTVTELNAEVPRIRLAYGLPGLNTNKNEKMLAFLKEQGINPERLGPAVKIAQPLNPHFVDECNLCMEAFVYFAGQAGVPVPSAEEYPSTVPGIPTFLSFPADTLAAVAELAPNLVQRMRKLAHLPEDRKAS